MLLEQKIRMLLPAQAFSEGGAPGKLLLWLRSSGSMYVYVLILGEKRNRDGLLNPYRTVTMYSQPNVVIFQ